MAELFDMLCFNITYGSSGLAKFHIENGYDVNTQSLDNANTFLIHASQQGFLDLVKYLIKHGADPNMQNKYGCTALHYAVRYNFEEIIKYLIKYGANPYIKNNKGETCDSFINFSILESIPLKINKFLIKDTIDVWI